MRIDITRFGNTNNGMDKKVCIALKSSPKCQLLVRSVHWVTGLERDHPVPATPGELSAQARWRVPQ
jgi:hypothetical protein